jgi:hypothetical protein
VAAARNRALGGTPPVIIETLKLFGLLARRAPTQARHTTSYFIVSIDDLEIK